LSKKDKEVLAKQPAFLRTISGNKSSRAELENRPTTAPASWTHSKRFACQFIHMNLRGLRA
jgi:hypothetical protein